MRVSVVNIEFRETILIGKTAQSAKKIECIADGFAEIPGGVRYWFKVAGAGGWYETGKEMKSTTLFHAAVFVIKVFINFIQEEMAKDQESKLFVEIDGRIVRADLSDLFKGLRYSAGS